jgi:predicted XRE-type DNA-binding protein
MAVQARRSSGNVFSDLGFAEDEAENLKIRADLMIELTKLIETLALTQAAAAKLLGVTQPRVSDLMRGKIDRFSVDGLIAMLGHAGVCVSIAVAPRNPVPALRGTLG